MFYLFLFSYVLTLFGFLLGKSTKEEKEEIEFFVKKFVRALTLFVFALLIYFLLRSLLLILLTLMIGIYLLTFKYPLLKDIHLIVFFVFGFSFFTKILEMPYLAVLPIFVLFFENSMKKFRLKEQVFIFGTMLLFYLAFSVLHYYLTFM